MSVVMWSDELFDELKKKFPDQTSVLEKARTSIGLTHNFKNIPQEDKGDVTIGVYRKETECKTDDPCDREQKKQVSGNELILCQCISSDTDPDVFADSFVTTSGIMIRKI